MIVDLKRNNEARRYFRQWLASLRYAALYLASTPTRLIFLRKYLSPCGRGRPPIKNWGSGEGVFKKAHLIPSFIVLLICVFSVPSFGWSAVGHKIVAHIAYDHLTPKARAAVDQLTLQNDNAQFTGQSRFAYISTWADYIRAKGDHRFDQWHYIGLPLSADGTAIHQFKTPNVVWAIEKAGFTLVDPNSSEKEKKLNLKLLVHFVGDIHQPLHAVNRYSRFTPNGDAGGNAIKVSAPYAKTLHAYWDDGVGLFRKMGGRYPRKNTSIRRVANIIERKEPIQKFPKKMLDSTPMEWAQESRQLARRFAYKLKFNHRPNQHYVENGQKVVEYQLALAGYRLANMLNEIYGWH